MKKAVKYYCGCWLCMSSKEKKAIARKKEKRLFSRALAMVDRVEEKQDLS